MKSLTMFLPLLLVFFGGCSTAGEEEIAWEEQTQQEQERAEAPEKLQVIEGELVQVDTERHRFTVRQLDGTDMEFAYDERTQVHGADDTVEGLSTVSGSRVRVEYTEGWLANTAQHIEILDGAQPESEAWQ